MEIKQLKTFIMVAKTESFSVASELLGYAQPTVTTHIKSLEDELHVKLFDRLGHTIKLTDSGNHLLYYANHILSLSSEAISSFSEDNHYEESLTIGANESFSVVQLPLIIKDFIQKYPNAHVNLKFGTMKEIYNDLKNNEVDIAFFLTREINYPELIVEALASEPIIAIAHPDHAFSSKEFIHMKDFDNQDLIMTQENCTYREMIQQLLKENHVQPKSILGINNVFAIKQLVMAGLGTTILPKASVSYELEQNLLTEIKWQVPPPPVFTQFAYHKSKWISPIMLCFIDEIRAYFKNQADS